MPRTDYELAELKRAYDLLGVPLSASALQIRDAYRRLTKRWHPDRYSSGTESHREATEMMAQINSAYSDIEYAPLRYHVEAFPAARHGADSMQKPARETIPKVDRLEFWVRFVCGALLGVVLSLRLVLWWTWQRNYTTAAAAVGVVIACGLAAARYGDQFWHEMLGRWWWWR